MHRMQTSFSTTCISSTDVVQRTAAEAIETALIELQSLKHIYSHKKVGLLHEIPECYNSCVVNRLCEMHR